MADTPLIVCDPATTGSWYDFAYPLSWSTNCEVAEVLSDIPFISVGLLMFGLLALLLVVKRISMSTLWLFFSTLQAFVAVVIDLGQTLADGVALNTTFTTSKPAIRAREVLFALSNGFRFLFYWSYVAEPPGRDLSAASTQTASKVSFLAFERPHEPHSGSWTRWGLPGKLLGVGLLVAIIMITILQIVWRVVPQFHQYGGIYGTDAALELLVSFLLLLRLLSNTLTINSPDNMSVHTIRECLVPISGLLVNIAIGVGGLLCFAFTESTVGRLLQALEVYIILVFVVVTAFLRHRDILLSTTWPQHRKRRDMYTLPKPARRSTFRITLPFIETPRMSAILGAAIRSKGSSREVLRLSARRSLNHMSSWVSSKVSRNRAPHEDDEVGLWSSEQVKVDPPYTRSVITELVRSSVSSMQEHKGPAEVFRDASPTGNHMSITSALDSQSAIVQSTKDTFYGGDDGEVSHSSQMDPQYTTPFLSSSGMECTESRAATPEASLVYGHSSIQPHVSASDPRTSLDELQRQRNKPGQSIEELNPFSTRTPTNSLCPDSATSPRSVELTRSPSTGQRTDSSDVSLSSFPIPPRSTTPLPPLPSPRPSSVKRTRGNRQARFAVSRPISVQDLNASASRMTSGSLVEIPYSPRFNSIPYSPFGERNESLAAEAGNFSQSDSGGTQYDVTSFIGGLATPGEPRQRNQEKSRWPTKSESSAEPTRTSSDVGKLPPRLRPVPWQTEGLPASPVAVKLSLLARCSRLSQGNEPENFERYRTNDQGSRTQPIALFPRAPVTGRAEKGVAEPSTRPRLVGETDSPVSVSERGDQVQRMFVRPRPPPLVLRRPYTEQNGGIPRIQVLSDD